MELVSSILLMAFTAALILLCNYYRRLLSDGRREYPREELIYAHNFILAEWQRVVSVQPATGYTGAIIGALLGYMLSYTGGIYGEHYEDALFNSAIPPALWVLGQPYLREKAEELNWPELVKKFITKDTTFFFGLSTALAAQMLVAYGFYHALSFLWIFFNYATTVGLVLYYLRKNEANERHGMPERTRRESRS